MTAALPVAASTVAPGPVPSTEAKPENAKAGEGEQDFSKAMQQQTGKPASKEKEETTDTPVPAPKDKDTAIRLAVPAIVPLVIPVVLLEVAQGTEGTQGTQETQGTEGTQGTEAKSPVGEPISAAVRPALPGWKRVQTAVWPALPAEFTPVKPVEPRENQPFSAKNDDGIPVAKALPDVKAMLPSEKNSKPESVEIAPERPAEIKEKVVTVPVMTAAPVATRQVVPAREPVMHPIATVAATRISEEAVTFKRLGTQSLEVAVKPDNNTELSLHFTLRRGQVEVTARVERGDFQNLKNNWPELQQTLAQQGIRVNRLSESSLSDAGYNFSDGQNAGRQQQSARNFEEEFAGASFTNESPKTRSARQAARGWEVWA